MKKLTKIYLYGLLGNVFDHYELALYGLLAPIFASLFFPNDNQIVSYIKSYAIFPLFLFSRLLGAWYFGKLGDKKGVSIALSYTLLGMAVVSILIGVVPTSSVKIIYAPYLFFLLLMLQNFFASGEKIGGSLYVLENSSPKIRPIISSIYDMSGILGYILATFLVSLLKDNINIYWRYLYIFSSIGAFLGFLIRKNAYFPYQKEQNPEKKQREYKDDFSIVFIVSLSYALYYITMTLMNSWIPLISGITYTKVIQMNIYLLILDLLFLPLAGYMSYKFGVQKIMRLSIYLNLFAAAPLFFLLKDGSFILILAIRSILIFFAVLFAAPCHYYCYKKVPSKKRFQTLAIANVVGAHLGKSAPLIVYWIYQRTELIISPFFPILALGAVALYFLREKKTQTVLDIQPS